MAKQTDRRASSQARLIGSAARLVRARGARGVSVQEIGAAAQMSRGAVNFYFGSKDELLVELVATAGREFDDVDLGTEGCASAGAWLDRWAKPWIERPEHSRLPLMLLFEAAGPTQTLSTAVRTEQASFVARVADGFATWYPAERAVAVASVALATLAGLLLQSYVDPACDLEGGYAAMRAMLDR